MSDDSLLADAFLSLGVYLRIGILRVFLGPAASQVPLHLLRVCLLLHKTTRGRATRLLVAHITRSHSAYTFCTRGCAIFILALQSSYRSELCVP